MIIFVIVLAGLGLYLITSGIVTKGVLGFNNFIKPSSSTGSFFGINSHSLFGSGPVTLPPLPGGQIITAPDVTTSDGATTISPADIPAGYTASELSPYFHQVRLGSVSAGSSYYYGTITLDAYLTNPSSSIDITGWEIKTRDSGEYIPQAINEYDPSGLTPATDIRVKNDDVVYLYSSSAPFNLRLNECVGYIAHVANFIPALPLSCPYVDQSQIQGLTGQCQNYVETISSCQAPNMASPQISQNDYSCREYLENNFTYKSCFNEHDSDPNFLSNQIWVWTGSNVIDQYHDTVQLLDKNGLLVDQYTF
jgi:hypothetical protein